MVARGRGRTRTGGGATAPTPPRSPARWPVLVLVAVLAALAVDLYALLAERRVNAMLARGDITRIAELDTVRGRFARAFRLHAEGRLQAAIDAYGAIASESVPELRTARYFNLANLYLERAVELERADELQGAMSLVELAKQNYREILADDPHHWDSRYNLTRALEMLPDIAAVDYENERNPERSPQAPRAARSYEGLP